MKSIEKQAKIMYDDAKNIGAFINGAEFVEQNLKHQITEWQKKWQDLQELITDKIANEDYNGAFRMQTVATTLKSCIKDAYKIIGSDDVSDS